MLFFIVRNSQLKMYKYRYKSVAGSIDGVDYFHTRPTHHFWCEDEDRWQYNFY